MERGTQFILLDYLLTYCSLHFAKAVQINCRYPFNSKTTVHIKLLETLVANDVNTLYNYHIFLNYFSANQLMTMSCDGGSFVV